MEKWNKNLYSKALDWYAKGRLDKALDVCEKLINFSWKNEQALNLKGQIFYVKGMLDEARSVWKLNYDLNQNQESKEHLRLTKNDYELLAVYREGEKALENGKIDKALSLFRSCEKKDFNIANVYAGLGLCYKKKQNPVQAKIYILKALSFDDKNQKASRLSGEFKELNVYSGSRKNSRKIIAAAAAGIAMLGLGVNSISQTYTANASEPDKTVSAQANDADGIAKMKP